jgi:serine/threonine protein phosphatase PrpC
MQAALRQVQYKEVQGSSTALIGVVRGEYLTIANLGDSGLIHLRLNASSMSYEVVFKTKSQQSGFNCPYQVGFDLQDSMFSEPSDSDVDNLRLEVDDIVIAASDGVLDNLSGGDVLNIVNDFYGDASGLAHKLAQEAHERGKSETIDSPWCAEYNAHYPLRPKCRGGKLDDIAVVVGLAVSCWDQAEMDTTNGQTIL